MNYRVLLSHKAEADVDAVFQWYAEQARPAAAKQWFSQLMTKLATLETLPERCGFTAEAADMDEEIRELLLGKKYSKYRIIFTIEGRTVHILRIWHSARPALTPDNLTE